MSDVFLSKTQDSKIALEVLAERRRQDAKWGEQSHGPTYWLAILMEEVGEAARDVVEATASMSKFDTIDYGPETQVEADRAWTKARDHIRHLRVELIQTAAVAIAMIASLDRNELKGDI